MALVYRRKFFLLFRSQNSLCRKRVNGRPGRGATWMDSSMRSTAAAGASTPLSREWRSDSKSSQERLRVGPRCRRLLCVIGMDRLDGPLCMPFHHLWRPVPPPHTHTHTQRGRKATLRSCVSAAVARCDSLRDPKGHTAVIRATAAKEASSCWAWPVKVSRTTRRRACIAIASGWPARTVL